MATQDRVEQVEDAQVGTGQGGATAAPTSASAPRGALTVKTAVRLARSICTETLR